jgi:prefoldin subunit 5
MLGMLFGRKEWIVLVLVAALAALPQVFVVRALGHIQEDTAGPGPAVAADENRRVENAGPSLSDAHISARLQRLQKTTAWTALLSGGILIGVVGASLWGSRRFFYQLMVKLDSLAGEIDGTSYAVKTTGNALSDNTRRQSSAIVQTAGSHKQIADLSRKNAKHAGSADKRIQAYARSIETANETLQQLISSMDDIKQASEGTQKIVDEIDSIATSTNLLAINAGVESAKAGEAGQAFGVIAGEVRSLALRAGDSAGRTSALVESTIEKIDSGVTTVGRVVSVFRDTVSQVEDIKKNMAAISDAAQDQSLQLHGLDEAIGELETLTGHNVENSRRADEISVELQQNGEALRTFLGDIILKTLSCKRLDKEALSRMLSHIEELVFRLQPEATEETVHRRLLGQFKGRLSRQVAAVYTCRNDGTFIYSDPPAGIADARIRPWWQNAITGKPYVSPVYMSAINRKPCCTISVPFFTRENRIAGVLGVDLKL